MGSKRGKNELVHGQRNWCQVSAVKIVSTMTRLDVSEAQERSILFPVQENVSKHEYDIRANIVEETPSPLLTMVPSNSTHKRQENVV